VWVRRERKAELDLAPISTQTITFSTKGPSTFETARILKMKRDLVSSSERALWTKDFKEFRCDRELRVNADDHAHCGLVTKSATFEIATTEFNNKHNIVSSNLQCTAA
jgi:hypothetical protein